MQMGEWRPLDSGWRKREVMRTSSGIRKITAIVHTCVAKSMVFLRDWKKRIVNRPPHTQWITFPHRCTKCRVRWVCRALPARRCADWLKTMCFSWRLSSLPPPGTLFYIPHGLCWMAVAIRVGLHTHIKETLRKHIYFDQSKKITECHRNEKYVSTESWVGAPHHLR
jgi:hypothetical protein